MHARRFAIVLMGSSALTFLACDNDSFKSVAFTVVSADPGASADATAVTVPEGESLTARMRILDHGGDPLRGSLETEDPTVLVLKSTTDGAYVFLGVAEGQTHLQVIVDGAVVSSIPASVAAQTAQ